MIRKNTKFKKITRKVQPRTFFTRILPSNVSASIKGGIVVSTSNFSEEENFKIQNLREKMLSRIESRPKGSIAVNNNWIIDDTELSYIEVPTRKSSFQLKKKGTSVG